MRQVLTKEFWCGLHFQHNIKSIRLKWSTFMENSKYFRTVTIIIGFHILTTPFICWIMFIILHPHNKTFPHYTLEGTNNNTRVRWTFWSREGGGYSQKNLVRVRSPLSKTLTLFMTKICDFSLPYLWPHQRCGWHSCPKHNGLINDERVASSKKHTQFKTRVQKPYPI